MLRFTDTPTILTTEDCDAQEWFGHLSITSLIIESNGKVRIKKVGVLTTSLATGSVDGNSSTCSSDAAAAHSRTIDLTASILTRGRFSTTLQKPVNLPQWLRGFCDVGASPNYAVSVLEQTKKVQCGLILQEVGEKGVLVEIGTFLTADVKVEHVPIIEGDWIVL